LAKTLEKLEAPPEQVIQEYRNVKRVGDPLQRVEAANSAGLVLMRTRQPKAAIAEFESADLSQALPSQSAAVNFNLGRAYTADGNRDAALPRYLAVFEARPDYSPALEAAFETMLQEGATQLPTFAQLMERAIAKGQREIALQYGHAALTLWKDSPQAYQILSVLVRDFAITHASHVALQKELTGLSSLDGNRRLAALVAELNRAIDGSISVAFTRSAASGQFPSWAQERSSSKAFSQLLKELGTGAEAAGNFERALAQYSVAWMFDLRESDAAVYAAILLRDHAAALDRNHELLNRLVDSAFERKGESYASGDWETIKNLHFILGNIFELQNVWTPDDNPRTALFQYEHAALAEQRLRSDNPTIPVSPKIHLKLGMAYRVTRGNGEATEEFLKAAEAFTALENSSGAREAVEQLHKLNAPLTPQEKLRLDQLEKALNRTD
jgi:tetratricopeptide (TPR) repeat protein